MTHYPADHGGLEILPFERCLELLATVPVGRVGFLADGEIVVLPVNHAMDGPDPVFRTARGSKLSAADGQNLVAFEADDYDERTRTGWSVLVNGRAHAVYEAAEIRRLNRLGLRPWVSGASRPFWIRIRPATISGRRIPDPDADADAGQSGRPPPACRAGQPGDGAGRPDCRNGRSPGSP